MVATKIEGVIADADARYTFDETKLAELRKSSPWKDDPRYFQSVAIGPSAVMKMVSLVVSFVLLIFTQDDQFNRLAFHPPHPISKINTYIIDDTLSFGRRKGCKEGR